ncbi:MAG: surfeit locus 1 family protein [Methyloprofundus sp.]|nr:MAG: surfeit locus 1 family protein [Methyloprofundus sp.]
MKLRFLGYRCRIKIVPFILFITLLALLIRLGFWQLNRADLKREFLQLEQQKQQMQQVPLLQLLAAEQDHRYRKVELRGHYDSTRQFLIDNQIYLGKVGYFVMTPFILKDKQMVLVNRGWLPMQQDRQLPNITLPSLAAAKQTIIGTINNFPGVGLVLQGADEPSKGWPSVVQIINTQKINQKLNHAILDFQVQLSPEQEHGYIRDWQISTKMPPEKHLAYAFQWFALAMTLTLLILWISCKKETND